MNQIDKLLLETGQDIFISSIEEFIHQPSISEITYIMQGERKFFEALNKICSTLIDINLLKKNKEIFDNQLEELKKISSFDILIGTIIKDFYMFINLKLVFKLFFPNHICNLLNSQDEDNKIYIYLEMVPKEEIKYRKKFIINKNNYDEIINTIKIICCLSSQQREEEFNPADEKARKIIEKIQEGRKKIQEIKKENDEDYFLAKIVNILRGTGLFSTIDLNNMTIYELIQSYKRYNLYKAEQDQLLLKSGGFEIKDIIDWQKNEI